MTLIRSVLAFAVLSVAGGAVVHGQDVPARNPLDGSAEAIRAGQGLFRARCADCHGVDARGIRSPDLTQVWASGRTDDGLFRTLRNGVPGTEMRAVGSRTPDDEVWKILAYLRTLAAPVPSEPPPGNVEHGRQVFRVNCASCHRVDGTGGRLGPDLSRVGLSRSRQTLVRQIRGAMEDVQQGYAPVSITMPDGRVVRGVAKNEDLFSVQIMDMRERIQGYIKDDVRQVTNETTSAMPAFGSERLSEADLDDLLAYLQSLRGFDPAVK